VARFAYKPALLVARRTFDVAAEAVTAYDGAGQVAWRLAWAEIAQAAFVEHKLRGMRMRRLDLIGTDGSRRSIGYNGGAGAPHLDPEGVAHLRLIAAVLDRIAAARPDLSVGVGEHGRARWAIFATGAVSLAAAAGIGGAALVSGLSERRMAEAAVPLGLLALFGVALILANAPWRTRPRIAPAILAEVLRQTADPPAPAA